MPSIRRAARAVLVAAGAGVLALTATTAPATAAPAPVVTVTNADAAGPTIRFDTAGNAVDAHDGQIQRFGNRYYLYGTSYGCGFEWQTPGSPFCGFRVYSSPDLVHWTDRGALFDAATATWQARCDGATYGCYRPHVVHDAATGKYVLWINTYDVAVGYHVFTADTPTGPFVEQAVPHLGVNDDIPPGVNNGDHDVFVDSDGTAYLAFTDWQAGGEIVIERLTADDLSGTGEFVRTGTRSTEAPSLFRRGDTYYLTYSDPNCGYCTTGTSYLTASSPLGPWTGSGEQPDTWTTQNGALSVNGGGIGLSRAGADWTDYTMSFRATPLQTGGGGTYAQAGWVFRATDTGTGYAWLLNNYPYPGSDGGVLTKVVFDHGSVVSNTNVNLPMKVVGGQSYDVSTTVSGSTITTSIDGQVVDTTTDTTLSAGRIGFRESGGSDGESARFDDVRVTAPDGQVLLADDFSGGLGQWDRPAPVVVGTKISTTSCGGQPADVAQLPGRGHQSVYLYQSDRWENGAANEAAALHYWEPLRFDAEGAIEPLRCDAQYEVPLAHAHTPKPKPDRATVESTGDVGFHPYCDTAGTITRAQTFRVRAGGYLSTVSYTSFQSGHPDAPLQVRIAEVGDDGAPGRTLASSTVPADSLAWSPSWVTVHPGVAVTAGEQLAVVVSSTTSRGCYGTAYSDADPYAGGQESYSNDGGTTWHAEAGRDLHLRTVVTQHPDH